ncbi:hypothetical protein HGRIS_007813 [Hohenbuehelia grisea]|uniref:SMP-30/Gluconolactonase/LRE-like region domain-containing protein n=1 Tax=Hohenbuehelia grisea TaxID=104357 RepID=A0ABR3J6H0_9AGAR
MTSSRTIVVTDPLLTTGCTLGEAPLYDPSTSILHFVDIEEHKVFHLNTNDLTLSVEQFEEAITSLTLRREGLGLACTAAQGFAVIEGNSQLRYLSRPLPPDQVSFIRFNDGGCDSSGRYIAGTIYSKEHNIPGRLYRYDPRDDSCLVLDEGPFTDSNGLGWSPDEKTLYFTDSLVNLIYAYDYEDGNVSNRRVCVDALGLGLPEKTYSDGLCIDAEGYIWSARWGGSRVVRHAVDGQIDLEVVFPSALNITSCCFGGPKNDQLYVTSAHCGAIGGDASLQEKYPHSGDLFVVDFAGRYKGRERYAFNG